MKCVINQVILITIIVSLCCGMKLDKTSDDDNYYLIRNAILAGYQPEGLNISDWKLVYDTYNKDFYHDFCQHTLDPLEKELQI